MADTCPWAKRYSPRPSTPPNPGTDPRHPSTRPRGPGRRGTGRQARSVQAPASAGAATAVVEEHEVDDQVHDRPHGEVDRKPLAPSPAVAGTSIGHDESPVDLVGGSFPLTRYYRDPGASGLPQARITDQSGQQVSYYWPLCHGW